MLEPNPTYLYSREKKLSRRIWKFYSNIENLVLWARSEAMGCAVNICPGMMEYWNAGTLGLAE
jgi:hypothetical protein